MAEWVIRWEGRVMLEGNRLPINDLSQLPAGDFRIVGVDLTGAVMVPGELQKLGTLTALRELYLPGPIWNPGGGNEDGNEVFKALAGLTHLEKLYIGWHFNAQINIRDNGIRHLAALTEMKDFRCSQCRITNLSLASWTKLRSLDLSYSPFTDKGLEGLGGAEGSAAADAAGHHGHRRRTEASERAGEPPGAGSFRHEDHRKRHRVAAQSEGDPQAESAGRSGDRRQHGDTGGNGTPAGGESLPHARHQLRRGAASGIERTDRCRPALQPRYIQRSRSASGGAAEFQSAIHRLLDAAAEDRRSGPARRRIRTRRLPTGSRRWAARRISPGIG